MAKKISSDLAIKNKVRSWAVKLRVKPKLIRIQRMKRIWGSCSTKGTITLATDLSRQDSSFQDFVIVHELLHLKIPNHSKLFKALMTVHLPGWKSFEEQMHEGKFMK
jgi:predicted metal-dependent hydrolase